MSLTVSCTVEPCFSSFGDGIGKIRHAWVKKVTVPPVDVSAQYLDEVVTAVTNCDNEPLGGCRKWCTESDNWLALEDNPFSVEKCSLMFQDGCSAGKDPLVEIGKKQLIWNGCYQSLVIQNVFQFVLLAEVHWASSNSEAMHHRISSLASTRKRQSRYYLLTIKDLS